MNDSSTLFCPHCGLPIVFSVCAMGPDGLPSDNKGEEPLTKKAACSDAPTPGSNEEEPLSKKIRDGEHVKNHRLFRRWILAQIFRILSEMERNGTDFAAIVRRRGVRYMWKVIENEVSDMEAIFRHGDMAEFERRERWFNETSILMISEQFFTKVKKEIDRLETRKCRSEPYKCVPGIGNIFVANIEREIIEPCQNSIDDLKNASMRTNMVAFRRAVTRMCSVMSRFKESPRWNVEMPTAFINAFKGNGAYFGLRNLILFHNCQLPKYLRDNPNPLFKGFVGTHLDLAILGDLAKTFKYDGWRMLGVLKETLKENNIDIEKKMASWRK